MKKKDEILAELVGDAYRTVAVPQTCTTPDAKVSVLAAALDIFSRGSRYRQDALDIIQGCYPQYFKEEDVLTEQETDVL